MSQPVELPELPDCDLCVGSGRRPPNKATADSVIREYNRWGYTCDDHAVHRIGQVTHLVKAEG